MKCCKGKLRYLYRQIYIERVVDWMWCEQNLVLNEVFLTFELEVNRCQKANWRALLRSAMGLLCQSEQGAQCGAQSSSHGHSVGVRWRESGLSQSTHIWSTVNGQTQRDASPWGTYGGCLPTDRTRSPGTSGVPAGERWGSPPLSSEVPELGLFLGLCLKCLYTSDVWCSRCLAARCRRSLLVLWLFCSVQELSFPKSRENYFFP